MSRSILVRSFAAFVHLRWLASYASRAVPLHVATSGLASASRLASWLSSSLIADWMSPLACSSAAKLTTSRPSPEMVISLRSLQRQADRRARPQATGRVRIRRRVMPARPTHGLGGVRQRLVQHALVVRPLLLHLLEGAPTRTLPLGAEHFELLQQALKRALQRRVDVVELRRGLQHDRRLGVSRLHCSVSPRFMCRLDPSPTASTYSRN